MQPHTRRRALIAAGALLLLAGVLALPRVERAPGTDGYLAAPPRAVSEVGQEAPLHPVTGPRAAQALRALPPAPAETPVIHSVTVEKRSVCQMEENLVTVHASTPSGRDDAHLRYGVHGHEGRSVPLKVDLFQAEQPLEVSVYGREGTHASAPIPRFEVRDCWAEDELALFRSQVPGKPDAFRFEARIFYRAPPVPVVPGQPDPVPRMESTLRPVRYRWTFSDGGSRDTREPWLEHDLSGRPQEALYSQVLLTCEAIAADGRTLVARHALQLRNPDFESLVRGGVVRVHAELEPGGARVSSEGNVTQTVRLWHRHSTPVTLRGLKVRRLLRTELDQAMEDELQKVRAEDADVRAVLGGQVVVPPEGLTVTLGFASGAEGHLAAQEYLLEGTSADGLAARGTLTVMRPGLPPMTQRMLSDAAYQARVLRARAFLGRTDVTEDEVQGLLKHADGVYADLDMDEGLPPAGAAAGAHRGAAAR